jgi:hypothetical protein
LVFECWFENGQISIEYWYLDGKFHREDGPSFQDWYDNDHKKTSHYEE